MPATRRSSSSRKHFTKWRCRSSRRANGLRWIRVAAQANGSGDDTVDLSDVAGKACLVTGASRGIGAAVARALGECRAKVAVHYRSGKIEAEAVAAGIERSGGAARLLQADIA